MKARLCSEVKLRDEKRFGGICYVPNRNDFFALDRDVYNKVKTLTQVFRDIDPSLEVFYSNLAKIGICETLSPVIQESGYSGVSLVGRFQEIPSVELPLVVNCFSTSHCPLRCIYCHADDLMQEYRNLEPLPAIQFNQREVNKVIEKTKMLSPIVAVITGGEPLSSIDRAKYLIEGLSESCSLVMDTSSVGPFRQIAPTLKKFNVHIRLSLDSINTNNDSWRPINHRDQLLLGLSSSRNSVLNTISLCNDFGLHFSLQTVVHAKNDNFENFYNMREVFLQLGVKNWIIHIAVRGGKARKIEDKNKGKNRGHILPRVDVRKEIWKLIEDTIEHQIPLDIRCTDTDNTPNSVLLINSIGEVFTEGYAHHGKVNLSEEEINVFASHIDSFGHLRRYINWNPWYYREQKNLIDICYNPYS